MILALGAGFLFLTAGQASAAETYGDWVPSTSPTNIYTQKGVFNDSGVSEQASFACMTEDGRTITPDEGEILSKVFLAATDVYNGDFNFADGSSSESSDKPPVNGGYPSGTQGMNQFLANEIELLNRGQWVDYNSRTLEKRSNSNKAYPVKPGWDVVIQASASGVSEAKGRNIATMIPTDAQNPLQLTEDIPPACALSPIEPESPSFGNLFSDSGGFFTDVLLYPPASLASAAFNLVQPYAFKYTFFTPHSERGDLFWELPDTCQTEAGQGLTQVQAQNCSGGEPLGFSKENLDSSQSPAWFIRLANFLQWMVSGLYFIVFFMAAIVFMIRGNRSTNLRLTQLLPRLMLATVLTLIAGYLIGAAITFSNVVVKAIFEFNDTDSLAAINTLLLQSGNIVGGPQILQSLTSIVVGVFTTLMFISFILMTIMRQIILVALIVLAPLAAFSTLVDRWRNNAVLYVRLLLTVIFLPVIIAFILAVGMGINPLVRDPASAYGQLQGLIGLGIMLISFYLMYKSFGVAKEFVLRGPRGVRDSINLPDWSNSSTGLESGSDKPGLSRGESSAAAMLGSNNPSPAGGSTPRALPGGGGNNNNQGGAVSTGGGFSGGQQLMGAFTNFKKNRESDPNGKKLSSRQVSAYQNAVKNQISIAKERNGGKITEAEIEKIKSNYANYCGGRLAKKGKNWYLVPQTV